MALYELRQCKIRDGKMAEWLALMHREIVPYGMSKGMVFVASFCDEEWLRSLLKKIVSLLLMMMYEL